MAVVHNTTLKPTKLELLTAWLPTRPWYPGTSDEPRLTKAGGFRLDDPAGEVGIEFMVVADSSAPTPVSYLIPLTYRGAPLEGADHALIGTMEHGVLGRRWAYDGCHDPVLVEQLLALIEGRAQAQQQSVSDAPDHEVTRSYTGEALSSTASAADDAEGTSLTTPEGATIHLNRPLTPATNPPLPSKAIGQVTGAWDQPNGVRAHGVFLTVQGPDQHLTRPGEMRNETFRIASYAEDMMKPFAIDVPQADLDDLRERLARTRWPARLPGADWSRGVPVGYLRDLTAYWADGYDWRAWEAKINLFPQFTTEIDGQPIHFFHVRSTNPNALPLIITHSWPNSIAEFTGLLGPLSEDFHVVAPSLPGFGFSPFNPADERPWSIERVARTWAELMSRLGYERYGAHGNDAGALVSPQLGALFPEHVVGVHITGGLGIPTGPEDMEDLSEEERQGIAWVTEMLSGAGGSAYAPYLAARPQTLSYGWSDSPVAQLAYLVERFKEFDGWGSGAEPISRDLILTNASLYWLTDTGGSSSWTYYEGAAGMPIDQDRVPTGVSHGGPAAFRRIAEPKNRIVHWNDLHHASHMLAMAAPAPLAADISTFFRGLGRS